jgi:type IV secretory pathway VirB2 component (pilin)
MATIVSRRAAISRFLGTLATTTLLLTQAEPALAQIGGGGTAITFLQNIVNLITGTLGQLLSVIAVCISGVGALMGAFSMRQFGGVILGVMLIFSSAWFIQQIIGGA